MAALFPATSYVHSDTNEPYNVVLIVKDGVEFKAHNSVLSRASPFFKRLFNGSMKEAKKGVARLEMITESVMRDILKFIYTGDEQISADNAQELIAMADYLVIPQLTGLAEKALVQNLAKKRNTSNCLSMLSFGERYQCEYIISDTTKFVLANFSQVAKTEDFFSITNTEVEKWISSDEINVGAEENVFKIILAWIDRDRSERKKYFLQLFRQVRLPYVTRDFLNSYVVTNELVQSDERCKDLVTDIMALMDSQQYDVLSVAPRKSLETPVIVVSLREEVFCYFPGKDVWCRLHGKVRTSRASFHCGQLRFTLNKQEDDPFGLNRRFTNVWRYDTIKTNKNENDARRESEIYALLSSTRGSLLESVSLHPINTTPPSENTEAVHLLTAVKHKSTSNLDDISFDLGVRAGTCVVSRDANFIAFLGGGNCFGRFQLYTPINSTGDPTDSCGESSQSNSDSDNRDDTQEARGESNGVAACRRLIIGGRSVLDRYRYFESTRRVLNETTGECQLVGNLRQSWKLRGFATVSGDKLYALGVSKGCTPMLTIECFDPGRGKWDAKTGVPISSTSQSLEQFTVPEKKGKRKCVMM